MLPVMAEGRGQMARCLSERVAERAGAAAKGVWLSVLRREAVRRGRHVSPDRARSLRGTSEVTNLASSRR